VDEYSQNVIKELQEWDWIREVDVVDPTWIDVAYTWSWADSQWRQKALVALEAHDIYAVGRYARWVFQGIADSIRDGLMTGAAMRACQGAAYENNSTLVACGALRTGAEREKTD
jgi:hypothetical protein